ncbi:4-oxalocrotonate tautomerase [Labrys sp. KNU-23]|uniref:tautomerase family protein n=1 Tax=Labrys sp. KNU-23 TaxID=2789216 RepID=UPI0011EFBC43|nr:tautomerase family protein [Labrys sp. KNU-23]QEN87045.1 4-oxalocrotonate tautomerase [Labrys sp. KNU-23]
MPGIFLTVSGKADTSLTRRLADEVGRLTCAVLRKEPDRTLVMVDYVPHEQWFVAGLSLAELGRNSFRLEVTVTDETNTREEKAAFHAQAFELLSGIIGNVHSHSNVHIVDCRATAYGYGGITQDRHYQQGAGGWPLQREVGVSNV